MTNCNADRMRYGLPGPALKALISVFSNHCSIEKVILYGSRAKGNYRQGSDIDLCLVGESLGLSQLLAIENKLDDLYLPWKIDHLVNAPH